jgi:general secretion pathway protein H
MSDSPPIVRAAGFTLLELLVMIMIVGLSLGLIALALGGGDDARARDEAERFMLRANYVAEQTVLNNERMGLFVYQQAESNTTADSWCYRWQRLRANQWEPLPEMDEQYCLPASLQVEMLVENEPYEYDPELDVQPPVVVLFPSGDAIPFELAIYERDQNQRPGSGRADSGRAGSESVQRIQIDMMSRITWLNRQAEQAETPR